MSQGNSVLCTLVVNKMFSLSHRRECGWADTHNNVADSHWTTLKEIKQKKLFVWISKTCQLLRKNI